MPVVYRVKHDNKDKGERGSTFFPKKGEASGFRRENKKELSPDDVETIKVRGREDLCALLNDPHGYDPDAPAADDENEFI